MTYTADELKRAADIMRKLAELPMEAQIRVADIVDGISIGLTLKRKEQ